MYRLYDVHGSLLYIGSAYDPDHRCKSHRTQPWWPQVARRTDEWFEHRMAAYTAETKAIAREDPPHNVMGTARYTLPQTEAVLRRNEASRQRARVEKESREIWRQTVAAGQAEGLPDRETFHRAREARFAHIEASGLFPGVVARQKAR
ncbi:hypothetical protein ACIP98_21125 [Streptomyces sp. NPDC088354]|uniref:hypothetical protein n=1 Tax=Streptomyces sp. NPDC088354 TaxID=3365856 RepID=UPI00382EA678